MTDKPIRRGDASWRQRDDGTWEVWSPEDQTWRTAVGSPPGELRPPPPPPPRPPLEDAEEPNGPRAVDRPTAQRDGASRRGARTILGVVMALCALLAAIALGGRDWLFNESADTPASRAVIACGAAAPPPSQPRQYARPPRMTLEPKLDYWAIIRTSCGDMQVDLLEDKAPVAVNNFVFLAQSGFYNGLVWHHVSPDFIIQTGDPNGVNASPPDGPGYTIDDELPSARSAYTFGKVAFANAGEEDSSGSQFFIVVHDLAGALEGSPAPLEIAPTYTIFGRVPKRFFGSVNEIAQQPTQGGTDPLKAVRPKTPVYVNSIEVVARRS